MSATVPKKIVIIGASTGGPGQIEKIIRSLPILNNTTVIIAQHMSLEFIPSFAKRLQSLSTNSIIMAKDNDAIESTKIYLCHGSTSVSMDKDRLLFSIEPSQNHKYNPDINTIFNSLAYYTKNIEILGVILTGIGDDGVEGCKQLSLRGAKTITQDSQSAIVDGMPSRARKEIEGIEIGDTLYIKNKIVEFCS
ncbi:chemotaxis protein CheB [Sulfurimonas sp.]|uniref:chemotaxis protein CheB n=1 Tax=Sulfurimonas sp. TaxID=2022749 RepID=UPI0025E11440|nr:chemotaxis protein CheB [Sulfurimonas sp.]MCK9473515.1 chemotaxis protein CheB [Sulfurimonas sp.]